MESIKYTTSELESAHISLAELITNTKVIIDSTAVNSKINKNNIDSFKNLSNKFLNRESMIGYEMSELIESLKDLSKTIIANSDLASTYNSSKLTRSLDDIISNSNISDKTKYSVASNFKSQIESFSNSKLVGDNIDTLLNSLNVVVDSLKKGETNERVAQLKSDPSLTVAKNTEITLNEFIDREKKITLENLAKNKSEDLSKGSLSGGISYVEDLFDVNGATDFLSDKMGDLFGFKNIKEKLITKLGTTAKSIYSGVEEFLPEMFQLDEKRFYDLNKEIVSNSSKILNGLNNELAKQLLNRDKSVTKLKQQLSEGFITLDDFNKQKENLDFNLAKAEQKINKKRAEVQANLDDAIMSIADVDMSNVAENLYMTIEQNRLDMEKDLFDRKQKGIISERELEKTISDFHKTEEALKSNFETTFKTDKNFSLEDYLNDTSKSIRNSKSLSIDSPEVTKAVNNLNDKFDAFLDYNKQKDRQSQLDSDIFGESKDSENVKTEDGDNNSVEGDVDQGEDIIMDSIGSLLDMDGSGRKNKGRFKSNGGKSSLPSKAGGLGKSLLGSAGKFGSTALAAGSSLIGGAGSALAGAMKFAGPIGLALTAGKAIYDGADGWNNADENFGLKEGQEATYGQKTSSALGGMASGLSFGLLDEKTVSQGVHKFGGDVADLFGFGDNKKEDGTEKQFGDSWLDYTPLGLVANGGKALSKLFGDETDSSKSVIKEGDIIKSTDPILNTPNQIVKESEKIEIERFKTEQDKQDRIIELLESMSLPSLGGGWFSSFTGGNKAPAPVAVSSPQPSPVPVQKNIDDLGVMIINQGFFS